MPLSLVNLTVPGGDTPRSANTKINAMFTEIYGAGLAGPSKELNSPNLNDTRNNGWYYCYSPLNGPGGNGYLMHQEVTPLYKSQVFTSANDGTVSCRVCINGSWTAWGDGSTRGSNGSGEYIRFNSGLQICWRTVSGGYTAGATVTYNFPAQFSAVGGVFLEIIPSATNDPYARGFYGNNSQWVFTPNTTSGNLFRMMAFGWWK